ncbi:MAG: hypothetical protein ACOCX5_04135 [Chloroflexota bacterium]
MLMTQRLWHVLNLSARDDVIHRYLMQQQPSVRSNRSVGRSGRKRRWLPVILGIGLFLLLWLDTSIMLVFLLPLIFVMVLSTLLPLLPGLICGWLIVVNILVAADRELVSGRWFHIAATPIGSSGLTLIIAKIAYQRSTIALMLLRTIFGVYTFIMVLLGMFLIIVIGIWVLAILQRDQTMFTLQLDSLLTYMTFFVVLAALQYELIASVVTGCITGMLVTTFKQRGVIGWALGTGVFLLIQLVYFLTFVILVIALRPLVREWHSLLLVVVGVVGLIGLREIMIASLWYGLANRLGSSADELRKDLCRYC